MYIQKNWVLWGGAPETLLSHFGTWMRLLKISTFGVSNGVSPKPQSCNSCWDLQRSLRCLSRHLSTQKKPDQARRNIQKVDDHRAMQTGKDQIMYSPPHTSLLSTMVFPSSCGVSQGQQSQNVLAHQGPHTITVHIPTGKPQKHSVPLGKVTLHIPFWVNISGADFVSSETLGAKFSLLRQVDYSVFWGR